MSVEFLPRSSRDIPLGGLRNELRVHDRVGEEARSREGTSQNLDLLSGIVLKEESNSSACNQVDAFLVLVSLFWSQPEETEDLKEVSFTRRRIGFTQWSEESLLVQGQTVSLSVVSHLLIKTI